MKQNQTPKLEHLRQKPEKEKPKRKQNGTPKVEQYQQKAVKAKRNENKTKRNLKSGAS